MLRKVWKLIEIKNEYEHDSRIILVQKNSSVTKEIDYRVTFPMKILFFRLALKKIIFKSNTNLQSDFFSK